MPQKSDELFREVSVLSQRLGKKDKILAYTACMNLEEREIIGYISAFKTLFNINEFDIYRKAIQQIGRTKWGRTELTDLGLLLGEDVVNDTF